MAEPLRHALFLCTGNSARSILAESILNRLGAGRFQGHSAGSFPTGRVNPQALDLLRRLNYPTEHLRSKNWEEFARPDAPALDFIFTVCDNAAGETCPLWPGQPVTAHWGLPNPAAVEGSKTEKRLAFEATYRMLQARIDSFIKLPLATLEGTTLQQQLADIGQEPTPGPTATKA